VLAIASLIAPIQYCGDYRPYFAIYDPDFMEVKHLVLPIASVDQTHRVSEENEGAGACESTAHQASPVFWLRRRLGWQTHGLLEHTIGKGAKGQAESR
jgi:hypothetical protein